MSVHAIICLQGCHYLHLALTIASIWLPRVLLECPDAECVLRAEVTSTQVCSGAGISHSGDHRRVQLPSCCFLRRS